MYVTITIINFKGENAFMKGDVGGMAGVGVQRDGENTLYRWMKFFKKSRKTNRASFIMWHT